ncbi:hypothetical protein [Armatimonas rosea]|uniref:Uncharacterized protein n=1 Tax=Armatimonas rosea TaxID=685828 RepID=A0A7W9SVS4_ARMRO|nr:hypothetical protein [Armatimonas rosea]MBB6053771.1 hypothetical protein [Armatimonas rosea]
MKTARILSLLFLGLPVMALLPAQAHNGARQSYTFRFKGKTWTIQSERIQRKGTLLTFMGNVKATSNRGDKIFADRAELCKTPGHEQLTLSPVKIGHIVTDQ